MELKNFFAQDKSGNALPGATCYLYIPGTSTPATALQDQNGNPLGNPFHANEVGLFQFSAPDGEYDLHVISEGRAYTVRVQCLDVTAQLDSANAAVAVSTEAADRAEAAAIFLPAGTGAVSRTTQDKLRESISVLDFIPVSEHAAIRAYTSTYDCTAGIQAAIDYVIYGGGKGRVLIPAGKYRTTSTIHAGYGTSFCSVVIEGEGYSYRGESFNGTAVFADFSNCPAFNFQGARGSVIRGLAVIGKNASHISSNNLGASYGTVLLDDTLGSNWVDPALDSRADTRYAPYSAFTVDAYSGARPATSYPDVMYPAFLGAVSQYGKSFSSDCMIEDVFISGFVAGLVNQPGDSDGNGDFTILRRVNIEKCKYLVSVGNSQSRNVSLIDVKAGQFFSGLTNRVHGRQIGQFGGAIVNLSIGACINLLDIVLSYSGPITFINLYGEAVWRIGDAYATSSGDNSLTFQSCNIGFDNQNDTRGVPALILGGAQQPCVIQFIGGSLHGFKSVAAFNHSDIHFNGMTIRPDERNSGTIAAEYIRVAHNALAGGLVLPLFRSPRSSRVKFNRVDLDTGSVGPAIICEEGYIHSTRNYCIPVYAASAVGSGDAYSVPLNRPRPVNAIGKASFTSITLSGKTLTAVFSSVPAEGDIARTGFDVGDVIYDSVTMMTFFIRSRSGTTIIAEAQNNYKADGLGSFVPVTAFSSTSGTLYSVSCRLYTPSQPLLGTTSASSAVITGVGRDDGYHGAFDSQISVNDYLFMFPYTDNLFNGTAAKVTARDQTAQTMTLSGNASRVEVKRRLGLFVRKAPANS